MIDFDVVTGPTPPRRPAPAPTVPAALPRETPAPSVPREAGAPSGRKAGGRN